METTIKEIKIDTRLLESISKIAKDRGTDEDILITDILTEAVENYGSCGLVERLDEGLVEIKAGDGIEWKR
jgi:hypothetical protein